MPGPIFSERTHWPPCHCTLNDMYDWQSSRVLCSHMLPLSTKLCTSHSHSDPFHQVTKPDASLINSSVTSGMLDLNQDFTGKAVSDLGYGWYGISWLCNVSGPMVRHYCHRISISTHLSLVISSFFKGFLALCRYWPLSVYRYCWLAF